jgi:hypothetical protein
MLRITGIVVTKFQDEGRMVNSRSISLFDTTRCFGTGRRIAVTAGRCTGVALGWLRQFSRGQEVERQNYDLPTGAHQSKPLRFSVWIDLARPHLTCTRPYFDGVARRRRRPMQCIGPFKCDWLRRCNNQAGAIR